MLKSVYACLKAFTAAHEILNQLELIGSQSTPYGDFEISNKIGLAKGAVTGKGDQGIKSQIELLKRHGQHSESAQIVVEEMSDYVIVYKGKTYQRYDHVLNGRENQVMEQIFADDITPGGDL